eukprot:s2460_g4.t1
MPATPKRTLSLRERLQTEIELEDVFADERVRSNLPWSGGPEIAPLNAVITACARAQELAQCKLVLDTMKGCRLGGGCCRRGLWEQALLILGRARDLSVASMSTCEEGLKACFRGRQPRLVGGPVWVSTPAINTAIATCARFGLWTQAIALLSELQSPGALCLLATCEPRYSDILRSFTELRLASVAVEVLEEPLRKELPPG